MEYDKLKQLAQAAVDGGPVAWKSAPAPAAFMELMAPPPAPSAKYLIELEGPRGKVRNQWNGAAVPDLAGLSRALWESA